MAGTLKMNSSQASKLKKMFEVVTLENDLNNSLQEELGGVQSFEGNHVTDYDGSNEILNQNATGQDFQEMIQNLAD